MAYGETMAVERVPTREGKRQQLVEHILRVHAQMYEVRGNFNTLWQTVSQRVMPNYSDFTTQWTPGQRRTDLVFDSTAPIALNHGTAALESMLCPASRRWHSLRPADKALQDDVEILQYCDVVTECLFRARYAPSANFQSQIEEAFRQILTFGNGPFMVDDVVGYGLRYRALHLAYTFGIENSAGVIDTIHREWEMTAAALVDAELRGIFEMGSLPVDVRNAADQTPTKTFSVIHAIWPDPDFSPKRNGERRFKSCMVLKDQKALLDESMYRTQPIVIARYAVNPRETYGRGAGVDVLPEILALNEMEKTDLRVTQRVGDPPLLTIDDANLPAFNLRANSINAGYMSPDGKPLIAPLGVPAKLDATKEKIDEKRKIVQAAFLNDIFSILTQQPEMTATEVLQRAQEKGYLLAPIVGRIQAELISPIIDREIDILQRAGVLPRPPEKLLRLRMPLNLEIVYSSLVQQMQKQAAAMSISQVFQQAAPLIQADPTILRREINLPRTFRALVDANAAPASILNTDQEVQDAQQAEIQQQQLTNMAQIAGPASQAIKNLADANRAGTSATPGMGLQ